VRLAIFLDQVFQREGEFLATDESYATFFDRIASTDTEIVFIGREGVPDGKAPFVLRNPHVSLRSLPNYSSLYSLWTRNPRIYWQVKRLARDHRSDWDALLVHGPHPLGQILAWQSVSMGLPVIPVVRQNLVAMMRAHRGVKRLAATSFASILEADFRRLAKGRAVLAVGGEMAREYTTVSDRVHSFMPCLIDDEEFRAFSSISLNENGRRLICVGRLAPEKGHKFLLEAISTLRERGVICHLDLVGSGPLDKELRSQARRLGIESMISFHGFVGYGPELFEIYKRAGIAVICSLTEGFPQVINETLSIGLPTIATRVGGIPDFLADGNTALLVAPGDSNSLASAIDKLFRNRHLREQLSRNGRKLMSLNTLEAQRDRILEVVRDELDAHKRNQSLGTG
jgi:glycosyltransferase involved in cell wall biosynthesis